MLYAVVEEMLTYTLLLDPQYEWDQTLYKDEKTHSLACVCVCVCVRERERESMCAFQLTANKLQCNWRT